MNRKIIKVLSISLFSLALYPTIFSCSNVNETNVNETKEKIIDYYKNWYESLSYSNWEKLDNRWNKNAFSNSEQQSLYLYLNQWGDFWNEALHLRQEPKDQKRKFFANSGFQENKEYEIRGGDYKYIDLALEKATTPFNLTVYHGVEWLEKELYSQLKKYIKHNKNGNDYSPTIGKTIESYGYISTSLEKKYAYPFVEGKNWITNKIEPPLLEPAMFIINIKKGTKGVAWVSAPFTMMGHLNVEEQILIKRNTKYKITNWQKDKEGVNIFTLDLLDY